MIKFAKNLAGRLRKVEQLRREHGWISARYGLEIVLRDTAGQVLLEAALAVLPDVLAARTQEGGPIVGIVPSVNPEVVARVSMDMLGRISADPTSGVDMVVLDPDNLPEELRAVFEADHAQKVEETARNN